MLPRLSIPGLDDGFNRGVAFNVAHDGSYVLGRYGAMFAYRMFLWTETLGTIDFSEFLYAQGADHARVFDFFAEHGLTPEALRESYLRQTTRLAHGLRELGLSVEADREAFGGFVAVEVDDAEKLSARLARRGVLTDSRGRHLRLGPAPYVTDAQLDDALELLAKEL